MMDNKTIKNLLQNYDKAELQKLLIAILSKNSAAQQVLLDYCRKNGKPLKQEDYSAIILNQLENHWTRASEIIDEFNEYGGGPEEEEEIACDELEKMTELLETEEIPWEPRKELLEEVLDFIRMDNSGFSDMLTDVADAMCRTREEKVYLADFLSQSKGYYGNWASEIYRACGEDGKYLESKKANLHYSWDYLELARYYEKHKDSKQALQLQECGFLILILAPLFIVAVHQFRNGILVHPFLLGIMIELLQGFPVVMLYIILEEILVDFIQPPI